MNAPKIHRLNESIGFPLLQLWTIWSKTKGEKHFLCRRANGRFQSVGRNSMEYFIERVNRMRMQLPRMACTLHMNMATENGKENRVNGEKIQVVYLSLFEQWNVLSLAATSRHSLHHFDSQKNGTCWLRLKTISGATALCQPCRTKFADRPKLIGIDCIESKGTKSNTDTHRQKWAGCIEEHLLEKSFWSVRCSITKNKIMLLHWHKCVRARKQRRAICSIRLTEIGNTVFLQIEQFRWDERMEVMIVCRYVMCNEINICGFEILADHRCFD